MKEGTEFEKLAAEIFQHIISMNEYDSVEHDVMLRGPDGNRQIDILLRGSINSEPTITIVECKDYNKNISITAVDALHSKMLDLNATKAVLVSRKGFSSGAKRKAKRLGVVLCTAHDAKSKKWPFQRELPFIIEEHLCDDVTTAIQVNFEKEKSPLDIAHFNNHESLDIVTKHWNSNDIPVDEPTIFHQFIPETDKNLTAKTISGKTVRVTGLKVGLKIRRHFYFGYLDELESTKGMEFSEDRSCDVVFKSEEFMDYQNRFPKFKNFEDIPKVTGTIHVLIRILKYQQIDLENNASKEELFTSVKPGRNGQTYQSGPIY